MTKIDINIDAAVENFSNILVNDPNKTYFLDGPWGSGKTYFLDEIKNYMVAKGINKTFINLQAWESLNDESILDVALWSIFKGRLSLLFSIYIVVMGIGLGVTSFDLASEFLSSYLIFFIVLSTLLVFFKFKIRYTYKYLIKCVGCKKDCIVVIDDFDRLTITQQSELYKLFSLLHNRLTIIFVGDLAKVDSFDSGYLAKLIDVRVQLPFDLSSQNIWNKMAVNLEDSFDFVIDRDLVRLWEKDGQTIRGVHQFHDYVYKELHVRSKVYHVDINEQLFIIYLYLFYPKLYSELKLGRKVKFTDNNSPVSDILNALLSNLQIYKPESYPPRYIHNNVIYYVFDNIDNRSVDYFDSLFDDLKLLRSEIMSDDFYLYVVGMYEHLSKAKQLLVIDALLFNFIESPNTHIMSISDIRDVRIFSYMSIIAVHYFNFNYGAANDNDRLNLTYKWITQCKLFSYRYNCILDMSDILYFLYYAGISSIDDMRRNKIIGRADLDNNYKHMSIILLVYIETIHNDAYYNKLPSYLKSKINELPDSEFLFFWIINAVIRMGTSVQLSRVNDHILIDNITLDKYYYLISGRKQDKTANDSDILTDYSCINKAIYDKLVSIKSNGYSNIDLDSKIGLIMYGLDDRTSY